MTSIEDPVVAEFAARTEPRFEPNLAVALERLTEAQRIAVVLVHGFGWTMREVAECTVVDAPPAASAKPLTSD